MIQWKYCGRCAHSKWIHKLLSENNNWSDYRRYETRSAMLKALDSLNKNTRKRLWVFREKPAKQVGGK